MTGKRTVKAKMIPVNPDSLFLGYQERWINDRSRLKLMEKARQIGISWGTAYACTERTAEAGAKWDQWVSSRDDLQARLFIEDCKMWANVLHAAAEDLGEIVLDDKKKISAYVLNFASKKRIHSMSSNPDAQAGKRGSRALDEFALHPDPRKLWTIAYPGITWGGNLEVISTHRGSGNFFNLLIREIKEHNNPKKISHHRVTLEDALNEGFLYKLQQSIPADHEAQEMDEKEYFDFIKSGCSDEESFQQEYMCIPGDDEVAFLEYDLIAGCEYPSTEKWEMEYAEKAGRRLYAGLDIGRKKDLTVLWILELAGDVLYTRKIITLKNMSKPDQEKVLWPWLALLDRCCIDYTGLGIGWGDDAKKQFGEYRMECVTFTSHVKEALAYPVRGKMEDKKLRIPYDHHVRADLRAVTKETTAAGNIRFTAERSENGHCYDKHTEVLTKAGWKFFSDLSKDDHMAVLKGDELDYEKPTDIQQQFYVGEMVRIANKQIDLLVTPKHRLYIKEKDQWEFIYAKDIKKRGRVEFKKNALWKGIDRQSIKIGQEIIDIDIWLEFMGYFISQGFVGTQYRSGIYAKQIEYSPIRNCIEKLPFKFWLEKNKITEISSYRNKKHDLHESLVSQGRSYQRFIPRDLLDLPPHRLRILFDALMFGNGRFGETSWNYMTTSYRLASDIQELLLKLGMCGSITIPQMSLKGKNKREIYNININRKRLTPQINKRKKSVSAADYSGEVYCCTVPSGIIYVRRNGKCCWCGNSDRFWSLALAIHAASSNVKAYSLGADPEKKASMTGHRPGAMAGSGGFFGRFGRAA